MDRTDNYHHGALRDALINTGLELISEKGISGFTLREVAKRTGVSTAAPYHHFKDKAELLQAMSAAGWSMLGERFKGALSEVETPSERLRAIGEAYIRFAIEHTPYFRVMSRPDLYCSQGSCDGGDVTGRAVFEMLRSAVAGCYSGRKSDDPEIQESVLHAWVMVHGFSALWLDGSLRGTSLGELGIEELIKLLFRSGPCMTNRPDGKVPIE
ncbi:MAG: TetR/AcrR family transcriptional regulator [Candidatus Aegiribacteria sp.]|nr:TetR/AcrR family transcriptional regulator [Candidatus Aegiribacteria sp.]